MKQYNEHLDKVREEAFKNLFDTYKKLGVKQEDIDVAAEYHRQAIERFYNSDQDVFI